MPLDAQYKPTLTDIVQWSGISPVPDVILNQHKQAEIDKHPPSWGFRYLTPLRNFASIAPAFASVGLILMQPSHFVNAATPILCLVSLVIILYTAFARLKGPARWIETYQGVAQVFDNATIPLPIRMLAVDAAVLVPGSWFIVGELIQKKVVLDPYLMMVVGDEQICLGVWDGAKIIHIAQKA